LEEGRTRKIEWPENTFFRASIPGANRDAILLVGVEPNYRWRTFSEIVTELARDLGVELAVTLGALVADVPHTRPSPVTGAATDPQLVDELGLQLSRYEGPTGIVGVLLDSCRRAGIPSVSLWAAVPHYVQLAPSPPAAKALCERLGGVLSTEIDVSELEEASDEYVEQVSQAVSTDSDTSSYVEELERRADSLELLEDSSDLPSGEALAQEISRFLRERDANGDSPESGGPG
jgi:proteasome assembly chaperone (PAC2) family protein